MPPPDASSRTLGRQPGRRFQWKRLLVATAVVALLIAAATAWVTWRRRTAMVKTAVVERHDLLVRVLCDGRLEPPEGGELHSADGGTVAQLAVHEGDAVQRGQLLLRLANADLEARDRDARADLRQLQSSATTAGTDLDKARHEAAYRDQIVDSDRRLLAQGAVARATLDADVLAAQQAADRVRDALAQQHAMGGGGAPSNGSTGSDMPESSARLAAPPPAPSTSGRLAIAQRAAVELDRRLAALFVRAPFAGVAYGLPHATGESIPAGQLVANVTDPDRPHVRCRVDQPDLPRIVRGQKLLVSFNGLPERHWEGSVQRVGIGLHETGGREVGDLLGELSDPAHALPANAAVDVQVVVAQKSAVLAVPRSALRRDSPADSGLPGGGASGARYVFVVEHGHAVRRNVAVGLIGFSEVEVTSGLRPGERVVAEGPAELAEGTRVVETQPH